jgi:hypothetical protein
MESSGPASTEDVYDRIVRRGSFTFKKYHSPLTILSRRLATLAQEGQADAVTQGSQLRWQWNRDKCRYHIERIHARVPN